MLYAVCRNNWLLPIPILYCWKRWKRDRETGRWCLFFPPSRPKSGIELLVSISVHENNLFRTPYLSLRTWRNRRVLFALRNVVRENEGLILIMPILDKKYDRCWGNAWNMMLFAICRTPREVDNRNAFDRTYLRRLYNWTLFIYYPTYWSIWSISWKEFRVTLRSISFPSFSPSVPLLSTISKTLSTTMFHTYAQAEFSLCETHPCVRDARCEH